MANVHIGDDILHSILVRLPGKPLLRFRCVSMHWNRLISDPSFMKSRSRRMILSPRPLIVIDNNVPVEDEAHSIVRIPSPFEHTGLCIVGTLNGIVLLALHDASLRYQLILYNPLTRASKVLVAMDPPSPTFMFPYVFGFGYGATKDDLKIVRFETLEDPKYFPKYKCDAFDFKTSSWSTSPRYFEKYFGFGGDSGTFLDGFLYWSVYFPLMGIIALNVTEMALSIVDIPKPSRGTHGGLILGSLDGCLCMVNNSIRRSTFDMWLMKEKGVWLKACSFSLDSERNVFYPICTLGDGKILIRSCLNQLVIYDTSKDSYKELNGLVSTPDKYFRIDTSMYKKNPLMYSRSIEYVESLVSPTDMCFI